MNGNAPAASMRRVCASSFGSQCRGSRPRSVVPLDDMVQLPTRRKGASTPCPSPTWRDRCREAPGLGWHRLLVTAAWRSRSTVTRQAVHYRFPQATQRGNMPEGLFPRQLSRAATRHGAASIPDSRRGPDPEETARQVPAPGHSLHKGPGSADIGLAGA